MTIAIVLVNAVPSMTEASGCLLRSAFKGSPFQFWGPLDPHLDGYSFGLGAEEGGDPIIVAGSQNYALPPGTALHRMRMLGLL